ncbi:hypothetical protein DN051_01965 [Streptomyces cadmiisoli]|uniref:Integrase catalytic domain-containing protein n=1 Tax=Streptomyces cadmiisoli TaxID=2184053 RepID=A0A2Z4ISE0_9ACTN|nr:hypothetical protein DN051_01965 [Streptomyces cadmiisoli]
MSGLVVVTGDAVSETFNSALKGECVHRHTFVTRTEVGLRITTRSSGLCNTYRPHSVIGYRSLVGYEHDHRANFALGRAIWEISRVRGGREIRFPSARSLHRRSIGASTRTGLLPG